MSDMIGYLCTRYYWFGPYFYFKYATHFARGRAEVTDVVGS